MIKVDGRQAASEISRSGLVPLNDSEAERVAGGARTQPYEVIPAGVVLPVQAVINARAMLTKPIPVEPGGGAA